MRARLAIKASGIIVELRELKLQNKPQDFLNLSLKATVPVLQISSKKIIEESFDIMEWALNINDPFKWLDLEILTGIEVLDIMSKFENGFKRNLDRYKYSTKFDQPNPKLFRDNNFIILNEFNNLLENKKGLFCSHFNILDFAIFPFIRQFRNVDEIWFDSLELKFLQSWLYELIDSNEFSSIMKKNDVWKPNQKSIYTNFSN